MFSAAAAPPEASDGKRSAGASLRRGVPWAVAGGVAVVAVATLLMAAQPAFYRRALAAGDGGAEGEARARRLVTKVSAVHAAVTRPPADAAAGPGRWEAAIRDDELNAWLAIDLPRSHPSWLPRGVTAPRCGFRHRHAEVAARLTYGPVSAVASLDLEIVLRDVNQLGIVLERARLGAIPLPRQAILRELARRIAGLGCTTDLRRLDGRLMLVVHVPAARDAGASRHRIDMLTLADGEVLLAGTTGGPPARAQDRPVAAGTP